VHADAADVTGAGSVCNRGYEKFGSEAVTFALEALVIAHRIGLRQRRLPTREAAVAATAVDHEGRFETSTRREMEVSCPIVRA